MSSAHATMQQVFCCSNSVSACVCVCVYVCVCVCVSLLTRVSLKFKSSTKCQQFTYGTVQLQLHFYTRVHARQHAVFRVCIA